MGALLDFIVPISADERSFGSLRPATAGAARESLKENGCVLLRGAFQERVIDKLHREFTARYGALDDARMARESLKPAPNAVMEVGEKRYEITLRMEGAFAAVEAFANPLLLGLLKPLLGKQMRLSGCTAVVSYPGATLQHIHRDHSQLFPEDNVGQDLPIYAVNVSVPLIDVAIETGPTGIWLGSHRWPQQEPNPGMDGVTLVEFRRGDAILIDYRTLHTGFENRSTLVRPILYLVYARSWFFDEMNHMMRRSLDMPAEVYRALPQHLHSLLLRAWRNIILSDKTKD